MKKRLLLLLVLGLAAPATAAPIRVDFSGAIESVVAGSVLDGVVAPGTSFFGFYELDPDNVNPQEGLSIANPPGRIYAEVGSLVFDMTLDAVVILDDNPSSTGQADAWLAFPLARGPYGVAPLIGFADYSAARLSSDLFYFETSAEGWQVVWFSLGDPFSADSYAWGSAVIVPEPGALALLASLGLAGLRRR